MSENISSNDLTEHEIARIQSLQSNAVIFLSGPIREHHLAICAELLHYHYMEDFNDQIHLIINSDGGQCSVGWAIIDIMNFIRLPVRTIALGECSSMAADIFVNGDYRVIGENATLMIHPHSAGRIGSYTSLLAASKFDDIEHKRRLAHYANNSNYKTIEEVKKKLFATEGDDLFMTPDECLAHGLADEIARSHKGKRRKEYRTFLGNSDELVKAHPRGRRKKSS